MNWLRGEQTIVGALSLGIRRGLHFEVGWWRGERVLSKTLLHSTPAVHAAFERQAAIAQRVGQQLGHAQLPALLARSERQLIFRWRDGLLLRTVLGQAPQGLGLGGSLSIGLGLLNALADLHSAGVVHHDIKPENVLLTHWQPQVPLTPAQVMLLDFDQSWAAWLSDLPEGVCMGTPHYMPPEQFGGQRGDPRSDLYAVGAVLFEALSGEPPHSQPLPWLLGHCTAPNLCASTAPPELQRLLTALLARDPLARPESAAEALAELQGVVYGLGLSSSW